MTTIFISHPPLYIDIHFIRPYQYRGTSKPYALASTITSICVEHLFWRVMFHTLPFVTPHLTVGTLQASIFHSLSPYRSTTVTLLLVYGSHLDAKIMASSAVIPACIPANA